MVSLIPNQAINNKQSIDMETTFGKIENGKFFGGQTEQGFVFKDMEAFNDPKRRDDICYISEGGFEDREALTEAQARAEIEKGGADTHNSLFNAIKDDLEREYGRHKITNEFVERICAYVIQEVDWQCTQTFYNEIYQTSLIGYFPMIELHNL